MSAAAPPGGFEGDLGALSIVEIVQTLSLGGKTGRLLVRSEARHGEMWFKDGEMTHAAAGSVFGDLAVYAMIEWTSGHFVVEFGLSSAARSITQDATYLVLEGLRRVDERSADGSSTDDSVQVPPVLEADVRRERSRRLALSVVAFGIVAGAIGAAVLSDWRSPSATDAAAAVVAPAPAPFVAHKAPPTPTRVKRAAPSREVPKQEDIVDVVPTTAPESPAAEESVPVAALVVPQFTPEAPAVRITAAAEPARLRISGTSGADRGILTVLVDGTPAYTREQLGKGEPFEAEIVLTPGEHLIVARLEDGARPGVHEDSARSVFVPGESRMLQVTANRTFGSPVKVKLGRVTAHG